MVFICNLDSDLRSFAEVFTSPSSLETCVSAVEHSHVDASFAAARAHLCGFYASSFDFRFVFGPFFFLFEDTCVHERHIHLARFFLFTPVFDNPLERAGACVPEALALSTFIFFFFLSVFSSDGIPCIAGCQVTSLAQVT